MRWKSAFELCSTPDISQFPRHMASGLTPHEILPYARIAMASCVSALGHRSRVAFRS
jgi:hypothetical protein